MLYYILNSYWKKFHEDKVISFKEVWKKAEKKEKKLMCCMFISPTVIIVIGILCWFGFLCPNIGTILIIAALFTEIWSMVLLYKYLKERDIRQTKYSLNKIKSHFTEVHSWLKELGYTRKAEIQQLTARCENEFAQWEKARNEGLSYIDKAITLFYVPTLLAIITWILASNQDMENMGLYIFLIFILTTLGVSIYLLVLCAFKIAETSNYSDSKKLKSMLKDFYGVLDYCFDIKDDELEILWLNKMEEV